MRYLLILICAALVSACATSSETRELKLGHSLAVSHPVHTGMVYMASRLEEISGGKMKMTIYPSGQLGNERETLELLQIGSLSMTKVSAAVLENFAPNFRVLGLPYIFESEDHMYKVLDGEIGEELLGQGEKYRFRGLCYYDAGSRSFYTKDKPVHTPEDLKGMKIRVMKSNTAVNMVNQLGGSPTPISFGELYTALQQGVVDGAENNPPSFYSSRHYEVCKYYTLDEHTSVPDVLLVSMVWWDRLSEQEQAWLKQATESVGYQRKVWAESVQESLAAVKAAGVEVIIPDKQDFSSIVNPIYDAYKDDTEKFELIMRLEHWQMKNKIDKILEKILVLLMAVMVLNVLWQVASRFLLNSPSGFTDELAGFLLIWVGLIGSGYATGQGLHMAIDILPKSLEGVRYIWVMRFIHFCVALFALLVMIIGGSNLVYVTLELEQLSSALQLPMGYVYLAVPLSGVLMIYYSIYYLIYTESNGSN